MFLESQQALHPESHRSPLACLFTNWTCKTRHQVCRMWTQTRHKWLYVSAPCEWSHKTISVGLGSRCMYHYHVSSSSWMLGSSESPGQARCQNQSSGGFDVACLVACLMVGDVTTQSMGIRTLSLGSFMLGISFKQAVFQASSMIWSHCSCASCPKFACCDCIHETSLDIALTKYCGTEWSLSSFWNLAHLCPLRLHMGQNHTSARAGSSWTSWTSHKIHYSLFMTIPYVCRMLIDSK